ncbi:hypothetical protein P691DRAFT_778954, partial [Macrolepiota fuliginosa MF-IS2]
MLAVANMIAYKDDATIKHLNVPNNAYPEPVIKYLLERGRPAAIGKSAVAQTVAEEFKRAGRLGASFFFSRPNQLDNPDWVIPTIVYHLATQNREYKRIVTQCLVDDILILDKNRSTQFRVLIIEPFRILMTQHPHTVREPLLITLDGLDECKDKEAHRPDWHLMTVLSNPDFTVTCRREELNICDDEAQWDVQRLLEVEFDKIRQKYRDRLPVDWPSEYQRWRIASIASGHLGFASFILRFIGDKQYHNPDSQLGICMMFLKNGHTIGPISPLHALDDLYRQVLSDIPADILSTTMRILGLVIIDRHGLDSANDQARFLGLDQVTFRRALQNLHSVVYVPPDEESNTTPLHIYHASFSDFLDDVGRSDKFHLSREAAKYNFALQCLRWIENDDGSLDNKALVEFSESRGWDACCNLSDDFVPGLVSRLKRFHFSRLGHFHFSRRMRIGVGTDGFTGFLRWLHSLGRTRNKSVIRVGWRSFFTRPSNEIRLEHQPLSAHEYIASFIPGITNPELPFTLKLRLGITVQVYITLVVTRSVDQRVLHSLREGFRATREKFSDRLPTKWPTESNLLRLAASASGDIDIAAFLVRFISDDILCDPDAQLKVCMKTLSSGNRYGRIQPPRALDPLYHHILSNIPTDLFPTTMRILGLLIFYPELSLSVDDQAGFLGLDQVTFRRALQNLRSVVYVPPIEKSNTAPLHIYHALFSDFLKDSSRSGKFHSNMEAVKYDIILRCLRWFENDDQSPPNRDLVKFSVSDGCKTCYDLSEDFVPRLISRLGCFDPRYLTRAHIEGLNLAEFIQRLYSVGSTCGKSVITIIPGAPQEGAASNGLRLIHRMSSHPLQDLLTVGKLDPATHIHIASLIPDPAASEILFAMKLQLGDVSQAHVTLVVIDDKTGGVLGSLRRGFDTIREKFKPRYL